MWFLWGASDPRGGVVLSFFLRLLKWISEEDTRIVSWDDVHYVVGSELGGELGMAGDMSAGRFLSIVGTALYR
jgi:hypothetical protein